MKKRLDIIIVVLIIFGTPFVYAELDFIKTWGSPGTDDGKFSSPTTVAVDSSGYLYVTELNNHRVQKFDSDGRFITKWGTERELITKKHLATGDGQFKRPTGIAVDSSGYVYVADYGNDRVQKFDSDGRFITKWGTEGSDAGQFIRPWGIAADSSGYVYVVDLGNDRVQKFDSDGRFITKWGTEGSDAGQFDSPTGIAVDSSGYIYVADNTNNRIQKFQLIFPSTSEKISLPNMQIVDELGNSISNVAVGQKVVLQSTLRNNVIADQKFSYIMQIKDSDGITIMISWIDGEIVGHETFEMGLSWIPDNPGNYTVNIFVWESLVDPIPLSYKPFSTPIAIT